MRNFYADKKILITGHTTFKGTWISLAFHHLGADVYGCSPEKPSQPNIYLETDLDEIITSNFGDLRNFDYVNELVNRINPDIIIHISPAEVSARNIDPKNLYSTNLLGTLNILEVCKQNANVKVFINLVAEQYPEFNFSEGVERNAGEQELIRGSFLSTEFLTSGYRRAYFNQKNDENRKLVLNVITCHVVGGGDWSKQNILNDFFKVAVSYSKTVTINDGYRLKFVHILDVINGILRIIQTYDGHDNEIDDFNLTPDDKYLVKESEIAKIFSSFWGEGSKFILERDSFPTTEIKAKIPVNNYPVFQGWRPLIGLEKSIELSVQWERARNRGANMQKFTLSLIREFFSE